MKLESVPNEIIDNHFELFCKVKFFFTLQNTSLGFDVLCEGIVC